MFCIFIEFFSLATSYVAFSSSLSSASDIAFSVPLLVVLFDGILAAGSVDVHYAGYHPASLPLGGFWRAF